MKPFPQPAPCFAPFLPVSSPLLRQSDASSPLLRPHPGAAVCLRLRQRAAARVATMVLSNDEVDSNAKDTYPRFSREDANVRRSFFNEPTVERVETPNERVMRQVRDTMQQLGVADNTANNPVVANTPARSVKDMGNVNPLSALAGAGGAALISAFCWTMLNATIQFALAHPMDDRIYIVQRVTVVIRTTLVYLFALGGGISGVTSVGLLLLFGRLLVARVSGEFEKT